jgi:hypothetical protein
VRNREWKLSWIALAIGGAVVEAAYQRLETRGPYRAENRIGHHDGRKSAPVPMSLFHPTSAITLTHAVVSAVMTAASDTLFTPLAD